MGLQVLAPSWEFPPPTLLPTPKKQGTTKPRAIPTPPISSHTAFSAPRADRTAPQSPRLLLGDAVGADGLDARSPFRARGRQVPTLSAQLSLCLCAASSAPSSCLPPRVSSPLLSPFGIRQIRTTWETREQKAKKEIKIK